ncbi:ATP-binding protein [Mycolicibacterium nivoides]|uniref:sensor histidine kinase n=1 Tax=Mycolicibacterium nivoides TaxID=2487344 RepID=UPI0008B20256|nr:ATP-binding protein [Mycolicibacterium nivoides]SEQ11348.1 GAF domain-containing protein [Mycobacterium sp. 88mf]SFF35446.1 GAF domain-containing protein [Mycobacterium sp. 455mf]
MSTRLLSLVIRPSVRPLRWGLLVAACLIIGETLLVFQLKRVAPENAFGAIFLLGVLVISAGWSFSLAVATSLVSALVYLYFHLEGADSLAPALFVFLPLALLANVLAGQARLRAQESEQRRREAESSHNEVRALAAQQTALRRVATVVARGAAPAEVCPLAVNELVVGLAVAHASLITYDSDSSCAVIATADTEPRLRMVAGERLSLDGDSLAAHILLTGSPARIDCYDGVAGQIAARLRALGLHAGVGAPITVDGRIWGAMIAGGSQPMPPETEARIGDFADLVATAIFNAESRAEITASRARVVAAADQARRGFERDLHDGAQQRIVSLGLELRAIQASVPPQLSGLRDELSQAIDGLADLHTDLQELSRGIHPAILSRGGLGPALRALARRSPLPVELALEVDRRLPESLEVATYYVVAEALTNAVKHSSATEVSVRAAADDTQLTVTVIDNGVGGAALGTGSGLIGLKDRVEALSGRLDISSPPGAGTTLSVRFPTAPA